MLGLGLTVMFAFTAVAKDEAKAPAEVLGEAKTLPKYELTKRMGKRQKDYLGNKRDPAGKFYAVRSKATDPTVAPPDDLGDLFDYKIEEQSALVYIPKSYTPKEAHGILLHLGEEDEASLPGGWEEVLTQYKLIYASPHKAGKKQFDVLRIALALDTIETLQDEYEIDKKRIIISGCQTGGAVALITAVLHNRKFCGVLNHGYGLLMRKTEYGAIQKDDEKDKNKEKEKKKKKKGLNEGGFLNKGTTEKEERPTWAREFAHADQKVLKRFAKETDVVFFIGGSDPHERMIRSAEQWSRLDSPFLIIDDPAASGSPMSAKWLEASCLFIEGRLPAVPDIRFQKYGDVRIELGRNNRKKKPVKRRKD